MTQRTFRQVYYAAQELALLIREQERDMRAQQLGVARSQRVPWLGAFPEANIGLSQPDPSTCEDSQEALATPALTSYIPADLEVWRAWHQPGTWQRDGRD